MQNFQLFTVTSETSSRMSEFNLSKILLLHCSCE